MVLRVQTERMHEPTLSAEEYILLYQLNAERLRLAKPEAMILHPGPMNRGVEISPEVADGAQSCVLEQVTNGIAVRMALLFLLMSWLDGRRRAIRLAEARCAARAARAAQRQRKRNPRMLLIKNGRVLDPARKTDAALDILLDGEKIAEIGAPGKIARATRRGNF